MHLASVPRKRKVDAIRHYDGSLCLQRQPEIVPICMTCYHCNQVLLSAAIEQYDCESQNKGAIQNRIWITCSERLCWNV